MCQYKNTKNSWYCEVRKQTGIRAIHVVRLLLLNSTREFEIQHQFDYSLEPTSGYYALLTLKLVQQTTACTDQ